MILSGLLYHVVLLHFQKLAAFDMSSSSTIVLLVNVEDVLF